MTNFFEGLEEIKIEIGDDLYPSELLDLVDPPEQIYVRGTYDKTVFANSCAIVGSRKMTPYGKSVAEYLTKEIVKAKVWITSGFMYGVDTVAHTTAILAGGKTIAVLGCGLNHIYPHENKNLYMEIIESGGMIISEYPSDFAPTQWTFPKRNRIVAALAKKGTILIEAGERSGTLITASYTDALNRPLYAVPGSIFSKTSIGTNQLIKDGVASMVLNKDDLYYS